MIWIVAATALAFVVGMSAVYIGLDINKDDEFCEAATGGAGSFAMISGSPCRLNPVAILTHFGKYFLLVYAPLMVPTVLYVVAAGIGAVLRRARSGDMGTG